MQDRNNRQTLDRMINCGADELVCDSKSTALRAVYYRAIIMYSPVLELLSVAHFCYVTHMSVCACMGLLSIHSFDSLKYSSKDIGQNIKVVIKVPPSCR